MSISHDLEIWKWRHQIWLFAINDVKLRYKNSVLGFVWTFLEPLLMLSVLYIVFTNIFKSDIEFYPLYLLLGLIFWYMFSRATSMGTTSLVSKAGIITKIYFPREVVVISACFSAFIMMVFEFLAFGIFLVIFQFIPPITIILLPLLLIDLFIISLGMSFILSSLNVKFRDIQFIWQVVLQAGFFLVPVLYTLDMFPKNIRQMLEINPMVKIIDVAHDITLYNILPSIETTMYIVLTTIIIFIIGVLIFRYKEKTMIEEL